MKKENNPVSQEKFKTLIGGQALIEGIMMQGPDKRSIVVRGPEGLVKKVEPLKKRTGIAKWPLIRGVVNFASSMVSGVKALMYSAEFFPEFSGDSITVSPRKPPPTTAASTAPDRGNPHCREAEFLCPERSFSERSGAFS